MQIDQVDHLVLTVRDIQATCEFYSRVLGMQIVTFAETPQSGVAVQLLYRWIPVKNGTVSSPF
jgi:catechol 2,3-dioxygenase-like lactoylglutathione lyase family enzyme